MTKIRVYELAKELKISSKELIERIEDLELNINSHMSTLDSDEAGMIKELLTEHKESVIVEDEKDLPEEDFVENEKIYTKKQNKKKPQNTSENEKGNNKGEGFIIEIENNIIVRDFAEKLGVSSSQVISKLIALGVMATQNETIDGEIGRAHV